MDCLKDWIGIRWQNGETPDSGLYINQLPGVSLKSIDELANAEQKTFLGVWDDVQVRSLKNLSTRVVNYFGKRYQLRTVNEMLGLPEYFTDGNQNTPPGANYRGFTYDLGWYGSPLAVIHVENLRLYLKEAVTGLVIKFFDIKDSNNASEVYSITVDCTAGWNNIKVLRDFNVYKLFVGYDATDIESVHMPLNAAFAGPVWWWTYNWGIPQSPYQAILKGAQSSKPYGSLDETNNIYGLAGNVSVKCSFESIMCNNKAVFTLCLWYLMGAELMSERIYSDRLNRYTTIDLDKAKQLRSEFNSQFEAEISAALDGIDLATWDGCLNCNAQFQLVHSLP